MPSISQFNYRECLPKKSLNALPAYLHVKTKQSEEVLLARLLTGTIDFTNSINGIKINQRINYSLADYKFNSRVSAKTVLTAFKDFDIVESKAEKYYTNYLKRGNKLHFKNLLVELSNYFYQTKRKSNATAFLHLYRSVELISYCFPLHYASSAKSYEKTYLILKEFFTKVDGELHFFKKFVNDHLFKNDLLLDVHLPIKITAPRPELQEQYFNAIKKLCDNNKKNIDLKAATPFTEFIISRRGLTSLIYDLRNRYFHLLTGDHNDNFSSVELQEIDLFYACVNDIILNWISLIYFKVLSNAVSN